MNQNGRPVPKSEEQATRLRLLVLHAQADNRDCGGSFQMLRHFLRDVHRDVFDVRVMLSFLDKSAGDGREGALAILDAYGIPARVHYIPVNQAGAGLLWLIKYGVEVVTATLKLWHFIRREQIDLVYTNTLNMLPGGLAARLAGVRSVYHIHEIVRRPPCVAKLLARLVGLLADRLLCVSRAAIQPFREAGVAEEKLVHVPNCIDLGVFDASRDGSVVRREFLPGGQGKLVVAVGRLVPKKGFHELIEAAAQVVAQLPECRFLFVGDTKTGMDLYRQQLVDRVQALGLTGNVHFAGPRADIPEIMSAADVAVLISASDVTPESFGLVVLEALAMGTPVVATARGGIPEVLRDGEHGHLVPPNDPPALAAALLRLLQDDTRAREMGRAGQQWVREHFSCEAYADKVQAVLAAMLGAAFSVPVATIAHE